MKTNGIPDFLETLQDNDHTTANALLAIRDELRRQWDTDNEHRYLTPQSQTPAAVAMFSEIKGTPEWHEVQAMKLLAEVDKIAYSDSYRASDKSLDVKRAQVHATLAISKRMGRGGS
jgi:hypothetical protein